MVKRGYLICIGNLTTEMEKLFVQIFT